MEFAVDELVDMISSSATGELKWHAYCVFFHM